MNTISKIAIIGAMDCEISDIRKVCGFENIYRDNK